MAEGRRRLLLVSDFNCANFANALGREAEGPPLEVEQAPFGPVEPVLMDPGHPSLAVLPDAVVVWTRPEGVVPHFADASAEADRDAALARVDALAASLLQLAGRVRTVLVPSWGMPAHERGLGMLDLRPGQGVADLLARMNLRLAEALASAHNVFVLDVRPWIERGGPQAFDPKLWYMAKVPFSREVFSQAARDVKAALRGLAGEARKLVVVDLDDTLWGGVVGDLGFENLRLGGHDPVGEAFVDFQRALRGLKERGILLAIASKNEESVALEAIRRHPEMQLRIDDFAAWRIDWTDKARQIVGICEELNLGLQSAVFLDDNPAERGRVREALPEVLVPEWPREKMRYRQALGELRCFDVPSLSAEDRERTAMLAAERQRGEARRQVGSLEDWLASLEMRVGVSELAEENLPRATQLLNKTNQMNLSTRRLTQDELSAWLKGAGRRMWSFRVRDRYGDAGLTGLISLECHDRSACIVDFVLSCRVFGRGIEEAMLHVALGRARADGVTEIEARYLETPKNAPCLRFWRERSGFSEASESGRFVWAADRDYPLPPAIALE